MSVAGFWVIDISENAPAFLHFFTFSLADVRCVCKNEDKCNNLEKPGRSNRRNGGDRLEAVAWPLLVLAAMVSLRR